MSSHRAETELGWTPQIDTVTALKELFAGMATRAGTGSPPLSPDPALPGRPAALTRGQLPGHPNPY